MPYTLRSPLGACGRKVYSQNDEDGVIEAIFADIEPRSKHFVEFGIGPHWQDPEYTRGIEGNCVLLQERGWTGLLMDAGSHPDKYGIQREMVTPLNVNSLLRKYNVNNDVDLISIDVDGQDFWIWMALDYRPTLIVIEMNCNFLTVHESVTVPFDPLFRWDGSKFYGASLGALIKLGRDKGYKLVYSNGTNAFFVRADMLRNAEDFVDNTLLVFSDQHVYDHLRRPWITI
jgi:hypothetical protein